jgi:glycosyltransferase involved in cell wall biosynthesis
MRSSVFGLQRNRDPLASSLVGGVSLIVPLQDEERCVRALVQSIDLQSLLPEEVLLVDAGSLDQTVRLASKGPTRIQVRVVHAGRVHPGVARNTGAAASTCEWLAFTDGGITLDRDWLAELAAAVGVGTDVVYGNHEPVCDNLFRQCAAIAYVPPKGAEGVRGPSVASCLVRRSAFRSVGGFPQYRAAEDLIFIKKLQDGGFQRVFAPRAVAHWRIAPDLRGTYARFASYSYHNLVAGWGRHWHLGVARLYGVLLLGIGMAAFLRLGWWLSLLVPGFFLSRALMAAWRKRRSFPFRTLSPTRVVGAAIVLVAIDVATFAGLLRWIGAGARKSKPLADGVG